MHSHTLYGAIRPFGVSIILASYEHDQPKLFAIEPSGVSFVRVYSCFFFKKKILIRSFNSRKGYYTIAIGKAAQSAKTELEKIKVSGLWLNGDK